MTILSKMVGNVCKDYIGYVSPNGTYAPCMKDEPDSIRGATRGRCEQHGRDSRQVI
jgi:hypothetical protein